MDTLKLLISLEGPQIRNIAIAALAAEFGPGEPIPAQRLQEAAFAI